MLHGSGLTGCALDAALSLGFLGVLDGLEESWDNLGIIRLNVFTSIYFTHIGLARQVSEVKACKGRGGRHIQHMQQKGFSAAAFSSIRDWSQADNLMPELQTRPKYSGFLKFKQNIIH